MNVCYVNRRETRLIFQTRSIQMSLKVNSHNSIVSFDLVEFLCCSSNILISVVTNVDICLDYTELIVFTTMVHFVV